MGIFDSLGGLFIALFIHALLLFPIVAFVCERIEAFLDWVGKEITDGDIQEFSKTCGFQAIYKPIYFCWKKRLNYDQRIVLSIGSVLWIFFCGLFTVLSWANPRRDAINVFEWFFGITYEVGQYLWSIPVLLFLGWASIWAMKKVYRIHKILNTHVEDRSIHKYDQE